MLEVQKIHESLDWLRHLPFARIKKKYASPASAAGLSASTWVNLPQRTTGAVGSAVDANV